MIRAQCNSGSVGERVGSGDSIREEEPGLSELHRPDALQGRSVGKVHPGCAVGSLGDYIAPVVLRIYDERLGIVGTVVVDKYLHLRRDSARRPARIGNSVQPDIGSCRSVVPDVSDHKIAVRRGSHILPIDGIGPRDLDRLDGAGAHIEPEEPGGATRVVVQPDDIRCLHRKCTPRYLAELPGAEFEISDDRLACGQEHRHPDRHGMPGAKSHTHTVARGPKRPDDGGKAAGRTTVLSYDGNVPRPPDADVPAQRPMSPGQVIRTNKDFRKVWICGAVSDIGTWMQLMTVGTLVASRTGSALQTGLVAAATFAPQLISAPVGGVLADRYDRRHVLMTILALQTVAAALLTFAVAQRVGPGVLTLVVFGQGIVGSLANPVAASMTPDLVSKEALLGAASLGSVSWNSGRIVGPMLATLLIGGVGPTWCIAANAASFAFLFLALATVHRSFAPHATDLDDSVINRVRQGVRSLRQTRTALFAYQVCIASQISIAPLIGMVPILATETLGGDSGTVSALFISFGVGSLLGSLAVTSIVARIGRPRAGFGLLSVGALLTLALSQVTSTTAAVLVVAPLGACYIGGFVTVHSVIPRDSPPAERGRIASIFSASVGTAYSLGVLWMGALADATSLHVALAAAAIAALVMLGISVIAVNRQWRSLGLGDMASQRALDRGLATLTTT